MTEQENLLRAVDGVSTEALVNVNAPRDARPQNRLTMRIRKGDGENVLSDLCIKFRKTAQQEDPSAGLWPPAGDGHQIR